MEDRYLIGSRVPITFQVYDSAGVPANASSAVLTLTLPNGTVATLALSNPSAGVYQADFTPTDPGRHVATLITSGDNAGSSEDIFDIVSTNLAYISVADLRGYLGDTSATDAQILSALASERMAQSDRCRMEPYTEPLREALLRRVARNLAARAVPVATYTSFEGGTSSTRVPMIDPEIVRLESPYRKIRGRMG